MKVRFSHARVIPVTFSDCVNAYYRETLLPVSSADGIMYSRTQNENGTFNTRCLYCLLTVATSVETNQELERIELHHMCPERALAELLAGKTVAEMQPPRH
jgi:hypothetical protein